MHRIVFAVNRRPAVVKVKVPGGITQVIQEFDDSGLIADSGLPRSHIW